MDNRNYIAQEFDIQRLYLQAFGYVAPPFPNSDNFVQDALPSSPLGALNAINDQFKKTLNGTDMLMPLTVKIPNGSEWLFPLEPMISLKGGQKIIRRYPNRSKNGGSIKERWSSDDYKISIKGILLDVKNERYPEDQVNQLKKFCEYKGSIEVTNTMFRIFGIERIVITDFDIPFTSGATTQSYTINAYSDKLFDSLLTEIN